MKNLDYREHYRRNLPHDQPRGATFLVNFRLAGSLPKEIVEKLLKGSAQLEQKFSKITDSAEKKRLYEIERQKLFTKWDDALHAVKQGPFYLQENRVAEIVTNSICYHV